MRVLYVISTLGGGGAESQLCTFAECLKERYPDIEFEICALKMGGVMEKRLVSAGISFTVLPARGILAQIFALKRIISQKNFDIVHAHMFYSDIVSRFATIGSKARLVATHHGLGRWKKKSLILLDRLTKKRVSHFIMVSDESKKIRAAREKYPENKISVIYNGISRSFLAEKGRERLPEGKTVLGTIARFTENKQIGMMLDIIADLKKPGISFQVVGDGEKADELREKAIRLGIENQVEFLGWLDNVRPVIKDWSIFLMCSVNEDLPVSMLETMAQGIVPVASNVGGIPLLLDGGRNGILCDSGNRQTFVDAIKRLLCHEDEYVKMSQNCVNTVSERFTIDKNAERTVAVYKRILEGLDVAD